jgi:hypothetical protein
MLWALIGKLSSVFRKSGTSMIAGVIVLGLGCFLGVIYLSMYLWNTTFPDIFGVPQISFWQAFRLNLFLILLPIGSISSSK